MNIKELKDSLMNDTVRELRSKNQLDIENLNKRAQKQFEELEKKNKVILGRELRAAAIDVVCDECFGFGPIQKLLNDDSVTEIMVNGPCKVFFEKNGRKYLSGFVFDDEKHLRGIIERMLISAGKRLDESSPYVDFCLLDGSRVNIIIAPVAANGSTITIRKFSQGIKDGKDLIRLGAMNEEIFDFLIERINEKANMLICGPTGSGKTTIVQALAGYIDDDDRIVTIEDTLELNLNHSHVVPLLTKPANIENKGGVTFADLFRNSLRMRPSRIILGEIRGFEAMEYLQILGSGLKGVLAILHASSPQDALMRVETLALGAGLNLPVWAIREQIASGLDYIIHCDQLKDGSRKITAISKVAGMRDDKVEIQDVFVYDRNNKKFIDKSEPAYLLSVIES